MPLPYSLVFEETVAELSAVARLWKHDASGAEVLSFTLDDENKVFGVTFRTPPHDSTGVAHILEHSVLCGSEKYPVKEPFVELLKGSLQTFLNAFTYPDKTCYPVASTNLQDFYNLIDVYLDAVFFPRITPYTLKQEGWHLESESADGPFAYKGVVYNEMKGVYSSPDSILAEQTQQSLFPDTTYGLDSGGNPAVIPTLTFEKFSAFHQSFYHPANARVFFWGNDPEEKRLDLLDKVFTAILEKSPVTEAQKQRIVADSHVALQNKFPTPREVEKTFATNDDEDKAMFTLNWLLPETSNADDNFALGILEHILLGLPGSPLRKALIESGLGEDITGSGLENDLRQMFFSVGLSGIVAEDIAKATTLIEKTLTELANSGIDPQAIDAAINSIEFSLRENNTGNFPVGLSVMVRSLTTWLYESNPLAVLRFEKPITALKTRLAQNEKVFEELIKKHLIANTHKTLVRLLPDTALAQQIEDAEKARVSKAIAPLSATERQSLVNEAKKLQALQEEHDTPEALASIPHLSLPDLPRVNKTIPTEEKNIQNIPCYFHNLPTNGLVYLDACFDMAGIDVEHMPLVPLLGRCFFEMGTTEYSYTQFGQVMAAKTGGIDTNTLFTSCLNDNNTITPVAKLCVSGKATQENAHELTKLMLKGLTQCQINDKNRFLQMALEEKARMEQSIVPHGNAIVANRIKASHSVEGWLNECTGGISYLESLKALIKEIEKNWQAVLGKLQTIQSALITSGTLLLNITTTDTAYKSCLPLLEAFIQQLPQKLSLAENNTNATLLWDSSQKQMRRFTQEVHAHEALLTPSTVNYVGQGADIYALGHEFHGSMLVVLRYLRMTWLWDAVRVRGGAYGAGCGLNRLNGSLLFTSYRDPNIVGTIANYKKSAQWLRDNQPDDTALTTAIVGAIGDLDTHLLPPAKGFTALVWHLTNDTKERRQTLRNEILGTTAEDFVKCAAIIEEALEKAQTVILGGAALERVAESLNLKQIKVL